MPRTDLDLGRELRRRFPYRSLCAEVLMTAVQDRRAGAELSPAEWEALEWWAQHINLSAWILKKDTS
jgi:hypothetical protein